MQHSRTRTQPHFFRRSRSNPFSSTLYTPSPKPPPFPPNHDSLKSMTIHRSQRTQNPSSFQPSLKKTTIRLDSNQSMVEYDFGRTRFGLETVGKANEECRKMKKSYTVLGRQANLERKYQSSRKVGKASGGNRGARVKETRRGGQHSFFDVRERYGVYCFGVLVMGQGQRDGAFFHGGKPD